MTGAQAMIDETDREADRRATYVAEQADFSLDKASRQVLCLLGLMDRKYGIRKLADCYRLPKLL